MSTMKTHNGIKNSDNTKKINNSGLVLNIPLLAPSLLLLFSTATTKYRSLKDVYCLVFKTVLNLE